MSYLDHLRFVEISPTELCNLQCSFCPHGQDYPNLNLHMSKDTIDKVGQSLADLYNHPLRNASFPIEVNVSGRGEPTLCKNYQYLLDTLIPLQEKGYIKIRINSNGYRFERYLESYLKCYKVFVNLYDNYTYEEYQEFVEKYKEHSNILIHFRRDNVAELNGSSFKVNYANRAGSIDTELTKVDVIDTRCDHPAVAVFVDWNGDYNLCCVDWNVKPKLDNIHETTISDFVLYNEKFAEYRTKVTKGIRNMSPCNTCNYQAQNSPAWRTKLRTIENFRKYENSIRQRNV